MSDPDFIIGELTELQSLMAYHLGLNVEHKDCTICLMLKAQMFKTRNAVRAALAKERAARQQMRDSN